MNGRAVAEARRVCRSDARPAGWIAIAYVGDEGACRTRAPGDSMPMAAILTRYEVLAPETVLEVCADERIPRGWTWARTPSADASDSCPGAEREGGSTTRRIRRLP